MIEKKLNELKKIFKLDNWHIILVITTDLDGNYGISCINNNDYEVTIRIEEKLSIEEQIKTLIHEIIHIIQRQTQTITEENINNENIYKIYKREMERETTTIANGIYELIK